MTKKYTGSMHYDLDGKPMGTGKTALLRWTRLFDNKKRLLKQEYILFGYVYLSTVWLGIDHGFGFGKLPILWETMAFCEVPYGLSTSCMGEKPHHDWGQWRYTSKKQALQGHEELKKSYFTFQRFVWHVITDHALPEIREKIRYAISTIIIVRR